MFEIPKHIEDILDTLNKNGYEAYLVGGCVRDFLMGINPSDYDITTQAIPDEIKRCFPTSKIIETGLKHGTVTLISDLGNIEITTFRIDGKYSDKRHPEKVLFTKDITEDLKRRDFTINAMALNKNKEIIDIFFGRNHIKEKLICTVGDADIRFEEDALRILRALRFASVLGFSICEDTKISILKNKALLKRISKERIFSEFKKLICGKNAHIVLLEYREIFNEIISGISEIPENEYAKLLIKIKEAELQLNMRLSLFLSLLNSDNQIKALKELKADNKTIQLTRTIISALSYDFQNSKISVKRFLNIYSEDIFEIVIKLKKATEKKDYKVLLDIKSSIIENSECYSIKQLKIDGNDISEEFGVLGFDIKARLNFALEAVIFEKAANEKKALISYIRENFC